ncbi:MAG: DsbA family protein [Longimicrobiales bacterium]
MAQRQRKPQAKAAGPNLKPFYWLLGLIAVLGVGWIGMSALKGSEAAQEPIQLSAEALANSQELVKLGRGVKKGPDNAPIRILVFSDYTCPACRQFTTNVEPGMRQDFIDGGKVQIVYHDFPLGGAGHQWGFVAARAARCAEDLGKFWEYHDLLFARQDQWRFSQSVPTGRFESYAEELQLDAKAFKACLNSNRHQDIVTANKALGAQLGVGSTPTLFMSPSGTHLDQEWRDYALMKARLEKELGVTTSAGPK